jgi:AcrR family transcriptional regulator
MTVDVPIERAAELGVSRRERKKAATRASISTAALHLFLERGFDAVSIRDIAAKADVAVATIFAHFSGKEALVFDEDSATQHALVQAVTDRASDVDVLAALEKWFVDRSAEASGREVDPIFNDFQALVRSTPVLLEYWRGMWRRCESALAGAVVSSSDLDEHVARLVAALVIEGYLRAEDHEHPDQALSLLFQVLKNGVPPGN